MPIGVGGTAVRMLTAGPLTAWVETVAQRSVPPGMEAVRAHDAVVTSALERGTTPLPARFSQVFESDDSCRAALLEQADRMQSDLTRVSGLVEMRIIARLIQPAAPAGEGTVDGSPGTAYMRHLQRGRAMEQIVQATAAAVRRRLTETVGAFVRGEALTLDPLPAAVLTLSHLVARDEVAAYRTALYDAAPPVEVERLVVCGPVAPYQFVSAPND
jgi:gas vesicle protein GvpL/GvpF